MKGIVIFSYIQYSISKTYPFDLNGTVSRIPPSSLCSHAHASDIYISYIYIYIYVMDMKFLTGWWTIWIDSDLNDLGQKNDKPIERCRISAMQKYVFFQPYPLSPVYILSHPPLPLSFQFPNENAFDPKNPNRWRKLNRRRWIPWRSAKRRPPKVRRFWIWCRDIGRRCRFRRRLDRRRVGGWCLVGSGGRVFGDGSVFFWKIYLVCMGSLDWWLVKKWEHFAQ